MIIRPPIMFHHFTNEVYPPGQGALSEEELDRIINLIGEGNILSAREWLERADSGKLLTSQTCLTFDDTLKCQYQIAGPLLASRGLTAFYFVNTSIYEGHSGNLEIYRYFRDSAFGSIDEFYREFFLALEQPAYSDHVDGEMRKYDPSTYLKEYSFYSSLDKQFRYVRDQILTLDQYDQIMHQIMAAHGFRDEALRDFLWMSQEDLVRLHRNGNVIGLHSHNHHTCLAQLKPSAQLAEYSTNSNRLAMITGERPIVAAHPCNSYGPKTVSILKALGVKYAFRSNTSLTIYSNWELPREDSCILKQMVSRR